MKKYNVTLIFKNETILEFTLNSVSLITIKTDHKTVKVKDLHEVLVEKVAPLIDQVVKDPTLPNIQEIKQNIDEYFS